VRRALEHHWPALLAGSACAGLALSNVVAIGPLAGGAVLGVSGIALLVLDGRARLVALGVALAVGGLWWGSLRLAALEGSLLAPAVGERGAAELVVTGPVRRSPWSLRVPAEVRSFRGVHVHERVLLVLPLGRSPPRGAILDAVVRVGEPRPPKDGFDERRWLARQGIHVVLRASGWRLRGLRGGLAGLGDRLRDRVEGAVRLGTSGERRAVVLGVVLGEDEGLSAALRERFRASGLYHLLAVSGQNVAFLAGGVLGLCWLLRVPRVLRELLILLAIGAYVLAVGWQPSVVRAGVAGALASLAWLAGRPRDRWHFLAVGALVLLAWTPATLLEPGFQLSFAAVAAIFLWAQRGRAWLEPLPAPPLVLDAVAVSTVCGLATAPIVLARFGQAPVYTVPANALAFPAAPLALGFGLLAAAASPLSPGAGAALAWLAGLAASWLELVASLFAALPGAQVGPRTAVAVALAAGAVAIVCRYAPPRGGLRIRALPALAAVLVLSFLAGWWWLRPAPAWHPPDGLRVTVLDVGQGDAVLLETATARILVDQGPPEADVAGQLLGMGIRSLSALVLTHPQRDHVGGAAAVLRRLRVGAVLDPGLAATGPEREEAIAAARARGVPVRTVRAGAEYRAGGLVFRVLWPPGPGLPSEDPNLNATVLLASFGETDVLLPADAESDVTARLALPPVEVLKVAHHGSADPGLDEELEQLRPRVAVVSAGRGNEYGHPRPETLAALAAVPGLAVYRTDRDGQVVIESDGASLRVRTEG